ncbi:S-layer homology domain-containing protein [Phascolarctobacterium succinatutens]|uniref:S-layer homology domain-containing protein n=1 Tax=Phascolarctobacterium succinatutens TaxID=626940 RepID=UPI003CFC9B3D
MNKVFKVIWSEARNAYVVVSEIAKNHGSKSCSTKKLLTMLIATGVMTCASMAPAMAAPNVDASATVNVGEKAVVAVEEQAKVNVKKNATVNVAEDAELTVKNGAKVTFSKDAGVGFDNDAKVKLGTKAGVNLADGATLSVAQGSNVSVAENITMGKGAHVTVLNGVTGKNITGDIAVGPDAHAWNGEYSYGSEGRIGSKEYFLDFGQGGVVGAESFFKYKVADGSKIAGSIAIGKNTVARTGSVMLGDHSYTGNLGDIEINPANAMTYNDGIYSTTLGAGAYNSGSLAAVTGALSIASGEDTQNTGATIYGSMNSIESATSDAEYSGIASSVLGFANRTQNANAALIWGTGNEITNSIEAVTGVDFTKWNSKSVSDAQKDAIEAMQSNQYAGGSVMAIGGGNKADYATYSELTGVQNKVTGTEAKAAKYDFVNGYQNTVFNASDVTVIGIKNAVTADGNKVIGDNHNVSGNDNVIFGSADQLTETTVNNAVVLGHNAKVTGEGGVALGAGSVADRAAGALGYGADGKTDATWQATKGAVSVGSARETRQITNVAAGTQDTDAVNVAQLKRAMEKANFKFEAGNGIVIETVKGDDGTTYKISTNITGADTKTDTTTVKPGITEGGVAGGNTGTVVLGPGVNQLPNQPATDNKIQTGAPVVIETVTKPTNFAADDGNTLEISPSETLGIKGDNNITTKTDANGKNIQVTLNKDLNVDSVNANKFTAGDTTITNNGLEIKNGPSVTNQGINAGDKKVNDVADGEISATSKDAVNGSQLHETNTNVANNSMRINKLGNRVNKVGAGAAALAALHPMDFDPDDKLTFSAGYGNYGGENAAAIGAYYRPDEKVMFSVGGTVGNGENMVNAGISFALDRTNHVSNSRTALAREVIDLRGQLAVMGAKMAKMEKALGMLDETKTKLFPDIPANHWAYEYIAKLAGNGYIEGYPDGNFGGDRLMTRYEFAAMLYRAIEKGAALEEKIIKEFEPELGRIRVDRISGEDGDRDKIERVRVNDTKGERDHYGNKLAK